MALEPGYTYSSGIATASAADGKTSISAPLIDYSRTVTATGTLTSLSNEACQLITFYPSGTAALWISVNSGSAFTPIPNEPLTFNVRNAADVRISGSTAVYGYEVSK